MKKIILSVALACGLAGLAQEYRVGKGDVIVGGTFSFAETTEPGQPSLGNLTLTTGALFFLSSHFAIGPQLAYLSQSQSGPSISQLSAGIAMRPYIGNFFLELDGSYNRMKANYVFASDETDYAGFGGAVGYDFFINRNVSIEPLIRYTRLQSSDIKANVIMFGVGFQIFLRPAIDQGSVRQRTN